MVLIAVGALVGAIVCFLFLSKKSPGFLSKASSPAKFKPISAQDSAASLPNNPIGLLLNRLRQGAASEADLARLRQALLADPAAGIAAIRLFLQTREDAATGQPFIVGPNGVLQGAPTLRLFLLDLLGQLSRQIGAGAGAEVAREILSTKDSPDEWALALRNLAWDEPGSLPYLASKMHEMLAYEPWTATPTSGMLEAFDVLVFTRDASFVPTLASFSHRENSPLQRAATVALDRLAENSPLSVMNYLNANPATIADLPMVRADYFAKADLGDAAQRKAVETYLDRPDVGLPEKTKFLHAIASPGSFVSDSLLSTSLPPGNSAARYEGIAAATADWIRARRFPAFEDHVQWLLQRATQPE